MHMVIRKSYLSNILIITTIITMLTCIFLINSSESVHAVSFFVTNTNDSGPGSLRQAIISANSTLESDTISFNIGSGPVIISPITPLPPIIYPIIIDGTTQQGFTSAPIVEINGSGSGTGARGFYITGAAFGSTLKGLIINRFSAQGIFIDTRNVTITGNYLGTNANGSGGAGNGGDGIAIFSGTDTKDATPNAAATGNIIGGLSPAERNVISGNGGNGIGITAQDGGNTSSNQILGNYVGTNSAGTGAVANAGDGILINHARGGSTSATGNIIGGTNGVTIDGACTGSCNLVSGNGANCIGLWHSGVSGTSILGNYVGTNSAGTGAVANGNIGIEVNESPNNSVGGTTPEKRNIFSGNGGSGVFLTGVASTGNQVQGNYVGTNSAGTGAVANLKMGIGIGASPGAIGANSNTIGGTTGLTPGGACTGSCNLISGNHENGIFITGSESFGHIIIGNYIGTNASGTGSIGNYLDGIGILDTPNTQIGYGPGNGSNLISGNGHNGIIVVGGASTGNQIKGNTIGISSTGGSLGNTASGVAISSSFYTQINANSISFNGILGIDLDNNGSVNQNDTNDSDGSANHLQNFPVVYAARNVASSTKIGGQYNGEPNSSFQIDFYYSDGCNAGYPNNYGEGQYYISSISINTDVYGNTAFGTTTPSQIAGNKYITATATKKINGIPAETSEFSQCILVNAAKPALTNGATWFLKYDLTTGPADKTFGYGFPSTLLMCAWDANQPGVKLPVIYSNGQWFMRASYTTGTADLSFNYGNSSHRAFCGDWDGDGTDTVGLLTPENQWLLRNSNSGGSPDAGNFSYGPNGKPVVGDWDGNGTDTVGIVTSSNQWSLRNSNDSGPADAGTFTYGHTPGYLVVGDWDGNGTDTIGSVNIGGTWSIRNSNSPGAPNGEFQYGFPGVIPVVW